MMDIRFAPHNTHLEDPLGFHERDPNLGQLKRLPLVYRSLFLDLLPRQEPGIYTITGGRQIGKTTLIKQWMAELLKERVAPQSIVYFTGELIDDHHSLVRVIMETLDDMPAGGTRYILMDEVTYIREWDKGVKYLADAGILENAALVLSGSDLLVIKEARKRFPGRRGTAEKADFHLYPLSFFEAVKLKNSFNDDELNMLIDPKTEATSELIDRLYGEFDLYVIHGGFMTAINDMALHQRILPSTFATYSDWIRGDMLKRGKQEHYLQEVLGAMIKRYGSQVTWNALAHDLSIDHPKTIADYMALLESMDAAFIQPAIDQNRLAAAPKKARKLMFTDPFIFHSVRAWLKPTQDPFNQQVKAILSDREWMARLAGVCVITHYRRHYPTFYIKAKGEIDIAYVDQSRFWPVEIKWTKQLRPKDLKQTAQYPHSRILTRSLQKGAILGIPTEPLPLALLRLS